MVCPKCRSEIVDVYPVSYVKTKNRGCFGWALWIFLAIITCGLILIIPLITNSKTKTKVRTEATCQTCGYRWKVD